MNKWCYNCNHRHINASNYPCNRCTNGNPSISTNEALFWEPIPAIPHADAPNASHPDYYRKGGLECFQAIDAATCNLTGTDAFDTGNAIKYLWRWKDKNGTEDLKKAVTYIQRIIDRETLTEKD